MLLSYGYLSFLFCFVFVFGLRMPRILGPSQFFWVKIKIHHGFTQTTITPPIITQSDSNREGMVTRIWKEPIQKEKVSHFWANNYCTKKLSKKKKKNYCPKKKVVYLEHHFRTHVLDSHFLIFLRVLIHEFGLKLDA